MGNRKNEAVILRQKPMKNGGYSLFLDICKNGKRKKEYIKLYIVPEETKADRQRNKQTLQLAKAIAAKRLIEVHNDEYGFSESVRIGVVELYDEFVAERGKRDIRENTLKSYRPLRTYFIEYGWEDKDVRELASGEINTFINHLRNKGYSSCTLAQIISRIRQFLNFGIRKGAVSHRATDDMQKILPHPKQREYLTIDEVRILARVEAANNNVKNAFLFSCLTGLRKCDIAELKWGQICEENGMTRLIFTQKKTRGQMYLDITPEAVKYLGERNGVNDVVYSIPSAHSIQNILDKWLKKAGITKRLTFHCARHTFATMMLELDVDIYVVSKLLGHSSVSTTQVYAKVVDKSKQNAVLRIPSIS